MDSEGTVADVDVSSQDCGCVVAGASEGDGIADAHLSRKKRGGEVLECTKKSMRACMGVRSGLMGLDVLG